MSTAARARKVVEDALAETHTWCGPYGYPGVAEFIARRDAFILESLGLLDEDTDDEVFCLRCLAGVNSDEHHTRCVLTGHAEDGEPAPDPILTAARPPLSPEPADETDGATSHGADEAPIGRDR